MLKFRTLNVRIFLFYFASLFLLAASPQDNQTIKKDDTRSIVFQFYSNTQPTRGLGTGSVIAYNQRAISRNAPKTSRALKVFARSSAERIQKVITNRTYINARTNKLKNNSDYENLSAIVKTRLRPLRDAKKACQALLRTGEVEACQPDYAMSPAAFTNDSYVDPKMTGTLTSGAWGQAYPDSWGLQMSNVTEVWNSAYCSGGCKGQGVTIALLDSGIDLTHKDFSQNIFINKNEIPGNGIDDDRNGFKDDVAGWDFVYNDNMPIDLYGHGTFLSGIISARSNNAEGISGIAPEVRILPIQTFSDQGSGSTSMFTAAVAYAVDIMDANHDGRVDSPLIINIASGCTGSHCSSQPIFESVIRNAISKGAVVIVAAGNSALNVEDTSPQNMDEIINVASVDITGARSGAAYNLSTASNYGVNVDLAAPGGGRASWEISEHRNNNILSIVARNSVLDLNAHYPISMNYPDPSPILISENYSLNQFTKMAAAYVAGSAALVLSHRPNLSYQNVKYLLQSSALPVTNIDSAKPVGSGIVDPYKAINLSTPPQSFSPAQPSAIVNFSAATPAVKPVITPPPGGWPSLIVSNDYSRTISYFDRDGKMTKQEYISTVPLNSINGSSGMMARDLVMLPDQDMIAVATGSGQFKADRFFGTDLLKLSLFNSKTMQWTSNPLPSSNHDYVYKNQYSLTGKMANYKNTVFLVSRQTSTHGSIIFHNTQTGASGYIDPDVEYIDVTVANGEIYGLINDFILTGPSTSNSSYVQHIRVFDAVTFNYKRTITLSPWTIISNLVVDNSGNLFGYLSNVTNNIIIAKFAPTGGAAIKKLYLEDSSKTDYLEQNIKIIDMNITSNGVIVIGSADSNIIYTTTDLNGFKILDTGMIGPVYVAEYFDKNSKTCTVGALAGDANSDCCVNAKDFNIWKSNYGNHLFGPEYGDFNSDGSVDNSDYILYRKNLDKCL